ncbi:dihydrodipicolinate synthase [Methanosalsum zhilinae DSM 4017]|uniref:4-hydroxy-tetrahydrodipicolinate synthase n=1 Tax=Methanosalsum zhilinae (strain DSM 4017 / NBRC 107636 / OCM 62 / WeN5) TaxID=679901 RepID=F7XNZ3_METZD|nr:4-hydroxy-tetrahydrodipicolinate synthase [Methanosalsum zhilinae]AEH60183.1 dihydrodipicolinate synthase [Methanosalsum zhilinae DSM 4017]
MFKGVMPALVTPFDYDGSIDRDGYRENVRYVEDGGVTGVVTCGTTGESATLSTAEHKELIDLTVECANVPVIAGTGSNNTAEAVELTAYAEDAGADGSLLISPYYNKPNNQGLIKHFTKISESVSFPLILYNVPSRTGQDMPLDVILELAKLDNIVGIKDASGDFDKIYQIIENTGDEDFLVYSGEDALTFPMLTVGGSGVISVAANVVPSRMVRMYDAAMSNDIATARKIHYEILPLIRALFLETNPIPVKRAMELIGKAGGTLRLPLSSLSQENDQILKDSLENLGVLV